MPLNPLIQSLIANFAAQHAVYKDGAYNETQLRRDFLDGFIASLGWDVNNASGSHETFREVVHEDRLSIAGQSKAPDYCVQLGGRKLFYVEAKKPAVNIGADAGPAYQVRRYGWNAKMPVCLLSNFAEFAVYDTTVQPSVKDSAASARIFYCRYDELDAVNPKHGITNYDYLRGIFSKEAVLKGSLERIKKDTGKRGTQEVDEVFLAEIENWRVMLANNIALRNSLLSERQINFAVQKTIDRVIFLRICEDRGIESRNILQSAAESAEVYQHLLNLFMAADEKYNSGLFDFRCDRLTPALSIDGRVLKDIIKTLYYPAPYEFAVMPADILGSIYERFLGKVIRLTAGHRAKVEEKPDVRKAGGVYYTPSSIVDYIVRHTIGEALKDKTPKTAGSFRVLDPACGSGSFLITAYQYLLDWYLEMYIRDLGLGNRDLGSDLKDAHTTVEYPGSTKDYQTKNRVPSPRSRVPIIKTGANSYKLSIQERKRILTTHIFGVDIDEQAVEVTKLSLLLKAVEGLNEQEIQKSLFHERVLPDLGGNIKCGNSLIGSDFYAQGTLAFTEDEQYKINAFDWEAEFPAAFKDGGFDAVIGNPPYVQITAQQDYLQKYMQKQYTVPLDLYSLFIEKGLSLLKPENTLGFIVPSLFLKGVIYEKLRMLINSTCKNAVVKEYGDGVFHGVKMPTCIILLSKGENRKSKDFFENKNARIFNKKETVKLGAIASITRGLEIGRDRLLEAGDFVCLTGGSIDVYAIKEKKYISKNTKKQFSKNDEVFQSPKIMVRETGDRFFATIDYDNVLTTRSIYNTKIVDAGFKPEYILGIINSALFRFYFRQFVSPDTSIFPKIRIVQLKDIPIAVPDKDRHDTLVALVEEMLALKKREAAEVLPQARTVIQRQIAALDRRIDAAVYGLYGLTAEEIKVVEGETNDGNRNIVYLE